jgi:hypothetical protein
MTEWHTISAKFTSEEKRILDKLHDVYGLNHSQSLKGGVNMLARLIAMSEFYVTIDSKTIKKINTIGKKYTKNFEADVKEILGAMPISEQEAQFEKLSAGIGKILFQADNIFVKNRKLGRKPLKRKRGRQTDTGKTS